MGFIKRLVTGPAKVGVDQEQFRMDESLNPNINKVTTAENALPGTFAESQQVRGQQQSLADVLAGRVAGNAPSAAEMQLRQGGDQAMQAVLAQQAAQRGGSLGLRQRQGANLLAQQEQGVGQQAAIMRAQEQQAAEQGLGGLLGGMRGQDLAKQQSMTSQQLAFSQQQQALEQAKRDARIQGLMASIQEQQQRRDAQAKSDAGIMGGLSSLGGAAISTFGGK